ncbi:MAG: hypothetical protein LBF51_03545 [Zoogloeaceae bacterium]|nr:hypothetical protein [Zoogloeaceae bacterium]
MYVPAEGQLIVVIFLLYLYDCIVLAYRNEVVAHRLPSGYRVIFPRNNATFGRRLLIRLPLVTPFYPAYRLTWSPYPPPEGGATPDAATRLEAFRARDTALSSRLLPGTLLLAPGILLLMPLGLCFLPILYVLALLPFIYLLILFQLYQFARFHADYPLSREKLWLLAVESLICPPCAINLVRKISLHLPVPIDLVVFAENLLPPETRQSVLRSVAERIEENLLFVEDPDAPQAKQAQDYAAQLRAGTEDRIVIRNP